MRKLVFLISVVALVAVVFFFASSLIAPEMYSSYICREGETMETRTHDTYDGSATNLYCVNEDNVARDVTPQLLIPTMAIFFVALFLLSSSFKVGKSKALATAIHEASSDDLLSIQPGVSRTPQRAASYGKNNEPLSLTDRLQELQQAYTMGLIDKDEYESTKQDLLEGFSE